MVQRAVQKDPTKVLQISERQRSAMANVVHGAPEFKSDRLRLIDVYLSITLSDITHVNAPIDTRCIFYKYITLRQ